MAGVVTLSRPLDQWTVGCALGVVRRCVSRRVFTHINPAAWLFAAMFLAQAALLFWSGIIRGQLSFTSARTPWTPIGWFLVAYALLYPGINVVEHGSVVNIPHIRSSVPDDDFHGGAALACALTIENFGDRPDHLVCNRWVRSISFRGQRGLCVALCRSCTSAVRVAEIRDGGTGRCSSCAPPGR